MVAKQRAHEPSLSNTNGAHEHDPELHHDEFDHELDHDHATDDSHYITADQDKHRSGGHRSHHHGANIHNCDNANDSGGHDDDDHNANGRTLTPRAGRLPQLSAPLNALASAHRGGDLPNVPDRADHGGLDD